MSDQTSVSSEQIRKRPSVSSQCLLQIKSIVAQNIPSSANNKNASIRSPASKLAPLPLVNSLLISKNSVKPSETIKETDEPTRRNAHSLPNGNALNERLSKSNGKNPPSKPVVTTNGHDQTKFENDKRPSNPTEISKTSLYNREQEKLKSSIPHVISEESYSDQYSPKRAVPIKRTGPSNVPPLPLGSTVYQCAPSVSSIRSKPSPLMATQLSYNSNEHSTPPCQPIPIHRLDSSSANISTVDDEDRDMTLNQVVVFMNSSLSLSTDASTSKTSSDQNGSLISNSSELSEKEMRNNTTSVTNTHIQRHDFNTRGRISYARAPHALRQTTPSLSHQPQLGTIRSPKFNGTHFRRQYPTFESGPTPVHKLSIVKSESPSATTSDMIDCCQIERISVTTRRSFHGKSFQQQTTTIERDLSECEARANYFRDVARLREIMMNVSKRLIKENDAKLELPIVDTHCHFDLIFDRLHIRHNDLKKYFNDYNEFYPPGLSFELAIQVFWRPKHLTESNWVNRYSKFLDDERVYGSCGIHPHWSSAWQESCIEDIERCLQHPKVVAIGEIGLDFGPKNDCFIHQQCRAFEAQLKLAAKWLKPIVIHARNAYEETFQLMKEHLNSNHKIHLHCFAGTMDDIELFTSYFKEIKFGFTPIVTRNNFLHPVIQRLELSQILSETDSPYFIPEELSSCTRCAHPGMVYSVVETVAQLRNLPVMDVAYQLRENARYIYGV